MRLAALTALVLAMSLAGCGEKTIQADEAEQSVTDLVAQKTKFEPDDVQCPEDVKAEKGTAFDCEFTGPDGPYTATVEIRSVDGDQVELFVTSKPSG